MLKLWTNCLWFLSQCHQQTLELVRGDSESNLHYAPSLGKSVIEDMLFTLQVTMREGLHQPCSQRECVISDEEVGHVMVIFRERVRFWEAHVTIL